MKKKFMQFRFLIYSCTSIRLIDFFLCFLCVECVSDVDEDLGEMFLEERTPSNEDIYVSTVSTLH